MFRVTSSSKASLGPAVSVLAAALQMTPAGAADIAEYDPYARPYAGRYVAPGYETPPAVGYEERYRVRPRVRVEAPPPECRVVVRRRVDPYGLEMVERRRICDGVALRREPAWDERPRYRGEEHAERRPRYVPPAYEPRPYDEGFAPRPPQRVPDAGEDLDDAED